MNPINLRSAPKCHCPGWIGTSHYRYEEGAGFGEWWERDCSQNMFSKINYDFLNNYLYLYLAIRQILLSGIICIRLSDKFYYPCIPSEQNIVSMKWMRYIWQDFSQLFVAYKIKGFIYIPKALYHLHEKIISLLGCFILSMYDVQQSLIMHIGWQACYFEALFLHWKSLVWRLVENF